MSLLDHILVTIGAIVGLGLWFVLLVIAMQG